MFFKASKYIIVGTILSVSLLPTFSAEEDPKDSKEKPWKSIYDISAPIPDEVLCRLSETTSNRVRSIQEIQFMPHDTIENLNTKLQACEEGILQLEKQLPVFSRRTATKYFKTHGDILMLTFLAAAAAGEFDQDIRAPKFKNRQDAHCPDDVPLFRRVLRLVLRSSQRIEERNLSEIKDQSIKVLYPALITGYMTTLMQTRQTFCYHCMLEAYKETDIEKSISLFKEAMDFVKRDFRLQQTQEKIDYYDLIIFHSLQRITNAYVGLNTQFLTLCQLNLSELPDYQSLFKHYRNLSVIIRDTKLIYDTFRFLIKNTNQEISFHRDAEPATNNSTKAKRKTQQTAPVITDLFSALSMERLPKVIYAANFIKLPASTYCSALWVASQTCEALSRVCPQAMTGNFRDKATAHSRDAIQFDREHVYNGEYKHLPQFEDAFISARLDDLVGNPGPLKAFYQRLQTFRQDRKDEQRRRKAQAIIASLEHEKALEEEKLRKIAEEKARQEAEKTSKPQAAVKASSSPFEGYVDGNRPDKKSPILQRREKVKTKGTPNPEFEPAVPAVEVMEENPVAEILSLSSKKFRVFQTLVGENHDFAITVEQVESLLEALGCTITPGQGSHRIATAPNGQIWTVPGNGWDGPIPGYYRHQLCDFLLGRMEINPDHVIDRSETKK